MIIWWIPITIFAALAQAIRFGLQKQLRATELTSIGTTLARFLYSTPLIVVLALVYATVSGQGVPAFNLGFWGYLVVGGTAQIVATVSLMAVFATRNFAVGVALIKTEVIFSVLVGLAVLGEGASLWGWIAILMGFGALFLLSDPPQAEGRWYLRVFNRAAGLGLSAGVLFSVSAVTYRGATLALPHGDALLRGAVTLACATSFQLALMLAWMLWRDRAQVIRVLAVWRIAALVGVFSMLGSLGWFTAFALQTAAYVKALGQVELAFVVLGGWLIFGERLSRRETLGLTVMAASVLVLVIFA